MTLHNTTLLIEAVHRVDLSCRDGRYLLEVWFTEQTCLTYSGMDLEGLIDEAWAHTSFWEQRKCDFPPSSSSSLLPL